MQSEPYAKDAEKNTKQTETIESSQDTACMDVLDATDIIIEEVSIDGICGVY